MAAGWIARKTRSLLTTALTLMSITFSSASWSIPHSDVALLGLMIDSYRLKIEAWSSIDVYSEHGPNIDAYPVEVSMDSRLADLDDPEEKLYNAKTQVINTARDFAMNWQKSGTPSWEFGSELEYSVGSLDNLITNKMSSEADSLTRARQLSLLLKITSTYVFMANQVSATYDLSSDMNVEAMVDELDELISTTPVNDHAFAAKWRYIKPVILKMDFRTPDLVKRHALSMAVILERSLYI